MAAGTTDSSIEKPEAYYTLLPVKTVASRLGIGIASAYRLIDSGRLKRVPLGERCIKVRESELRRILTRKLRTSVPLS